MYELTRPKPVAMATGAPAVPAVPRPPFLALLLIVCGGALEFYATPARPARPPLRPNESRLSHFGLPGHWLVDGRAAL